MAVNGFYFVHAVIGEQAMGYSDTEFSIDGEVEFFQGVKSLIYNAFDGIFNRDACVICKTFFDGMEGFGNTVAGDSFDAVSEMF